MVESHTSSHITEIVTQAGAAALVSIFPLLPVRRLQLLQMSGKSIGIYQGVATIANDAIHSPRSLVGLAAPFATRQALTSGAFYPVLFGFKDFFEKEGVPQAPAAIAAGVATTLIETTTLATLEAKEILATVKKPGSNTLALRPAVCEAIKASLLRNPWAWTAAALASNYATDNDFNTNQTLLCGMVFGGVSNIVAQPIDKSMVEGIATGKGTVATLSKNVDAAYSGLKNGGLTHLRAMYCGFAPRTTIIAVLTATAVGVERSLTHIVEPQL